MTITTYQIRNVLRTYGNQLKRRASFQQGSVPPVEASDLVDISIEARKRQVLSQLSSKLIAKASFRERQGHAQQESAGEAEEEQESMFNEVLAK